MSKIVKRAQDTNRIVRYRQPLLSHGMATHIKDNHNQQSKTHNQSLSVPSWVILRRQNRYTVYRKIACQTEKSVIVSEKAYYTAVYSTYSTMSLICQRDLLTRFDHAI